MTLFLIGLPGAGKSTLGRMLAEKLALPFCDMDEWIERRAGQSVPALFQAGEAVFRDWESRAIRALRGGEMVVACGGGAVLRPENRAALRAGGRVIWIDRPTARILSDIDVSGRPLLQKGAGALQALDLARRPLYAETAHVRMEDAGDLNTALESLCRLAKELLSHSGQGT